jgi:hypothetical protein
LAITPDVFEVNPGPLDAPALRINLLGIWGIKNGIIEQRISDCSWRSFNRFG